MTDDYGTNIFETIKITLVSSPRTHDAFPSFPTPPRVCHRSATTASRPVRTPHPSTHTSTMGSFTHNHLLVSPCSQITPRSAQALIHHRHDAHTHTRAPVHRCRHKLASMPRWLSSKKVETVRFDVLEQCPIALLATPLHNPFQVRALLAGAHAALAALPAPSHAH